MKSKQLLLVLLIPLLISCGSAGNANKGNTEAQTAEIIDRVEQVYKGQLTDQEIMSAQFYSVFHRAQEQCEDEVGWPDWDYWRCTQGEDAEMSITNVEVYEDNKATVHIDLTFDSGITKVELPMVYEEDNWFVDDIISRNDGSTYSLKDAAKAMIN